MRGVNGSVWEHLFGNSYRQFWAQSNIKQRFVGAVGDRFGE